MEKIRIMLVDDQMLLREGLKTIINLQDDMKVVAEAENGRIAVEKMDETPVDVILMDIRMPVLNGVEATSIIKEKYPDTSIIILTTFDNDDYVIDALSKGAEGYLLKDIDAENLTLSIRNAHKGQMMLPGKIAAKLAARISGQAVKNEGAIAPKTGGSLEFNEREREIGLLMAQGLNNRNIARKLYLSEGTVKNYISEIYNKLGTNNRTMAGVLIQKILEE